MNLRSLRLMADALVRLMRRAVRESAMHERFPKVHFGEDVLIVGADKFFPAGSAFIDHRAYLNCAGGDWNNHSGYIRIGHNVEIGPYAAFWGAGGITLGNNVHIGAHVSITAHEAKQIRPDDLDVNKPLDMEFDPVVIEDHALICSGTVIVPGVRIGHHAMIGGGATVLNDIPPYALAVGSPARVIRLLTPTEALTASSQFAAQTRELATLP
ncbi:MAG: hypothetical protein NVSMB64_19650 [Candidatus Velthaea sp.]